MGLNWIGLNCIELDFDVIGLDRIALNCIKLHMFDLDNPG